MKQTYNVGLAVLRAIMCFMVVLCHCWDATNAHGILKVFNLTQNFAVPVFILMSFILVQRSLVEHNKLKMQKRFERLLIPQIGWAIIYWVVYIVVDLLFSTGLNLSISDLIWQMFFGHSPKLNATMWYQVDLIYLTLLFLIVILIFKKNYIAVLSLLAALAIFIQYSGINMIFDSLRFELKFPIGRFFEILPVAVAGFLVASTNLLEKLKSHRVITAFLSVFTIFISYKYGVFSSVPGYGYQGIKMIVIAFSFVALFYVIPFEKIPQKATKIILQLTNYTMGIYCMHRMVSYILNTVIFDTPINNFVGCIVIYIICYIIAWIGTLLLGKTKLKALFN